MSSLLEVSDLTVQYTVRERVKLGVDNVSFQIPKQGYTVGLVGESGSGKTTLGMALLNLIEPPGKINSGKVIFGGRNVLEMKEDEIRSYRWKQVSMVYQSAMNSLNPVKRADDHIIEVFKQHMSISKEEARDRALKLLSEVGITADHARDFPHEMSGGMRQRVVIAMALALTPKLLIADEPSSALDVVIQRQILDLLKSEVSQRNLSLLFITHELPVLVGVVDNLAVMFGGEVVEQGPLEKVFSEPLHPYTMMLISSLLTLDTSVKSFAEARLKEKKQFAASVGCKYQFMCKFAFERCKGERPKLRQIQQGRLVACHKY